MRSQISTFLQCKFTNLENPHELAITSVSIQSNNLITRLYVVLHISLAMLYMFTSFSQAAPRLLLKEEFLVSSINNIFFGSRTAEIQTVVI